MIVLQLTKKKATLRGADKLLKLMTHLLRSRLDHWMIHPGAREMAVAALIASKLTKKEGYVA